MTTNPTLHVALDHSEYFEKYNLDISLPSPPVVVPPTPLEIAWKKVCDFFRKIWNFLCFWKTETEFKLTSRQIKLIEHAKVGKKHFDVNTDTPATLLKLEPLMSPQKPAHTEPYALSYPEDKTLSKFCEFLENFSDVLFQKCVFSEVLEPKLPEWKKEAIEGVDQVKKTVDVIVNLKNSAAPLFKHLGSLDDPALTILAQQLLQVLLQPLAYEQNPAHMLEAALANRIKVLKEKKEITEEQSIKITDYIKPTLRWLFNSNNWLINSPHPVLLHNFLTDALNFFDSFSSLNKTGALDPTLNEIKELLDKSIAPSVQELLKLNTKPIANLLSFRLSELIANMPFKESFDDLLKIAIQQMDGYIEADAHRKEYVTLIANAKHDIELNPTSQEEVLTLQAAKKVLQKVKEAGGEEEYLDSKFHKAFAAADACHPLIKKLILSETSQAKAKVQEDIFDHIIEEILPCILPPEQVMMPDGSHVEVSGVAKIVNSLQYTKDAGKLSQLADQAIQTVLDHGDFKDKDNFTKYFNTLKKVIFTQLINQQIKELVKEGLFQLFEKLSSKIFLDDVFGDLVLPALLKVIFESNVRTALEADTAKFAPIFHKFLDPENNFKLCLLELMENLYQTMDSRKVDFSMEEAGITKDAFKEIMEPLCLEIVSNLLNRLKSDDPDKKLSHLEIEGALKKYLTDEQVPVNPLYTDLILKSLFKIGNFKLPVMSSWTETIINWCKHSIAEQATIALHDFSSSYHASISSLVTAGNKHLLDPKTLKGIFFAPKLSDAEDAKGKELAQEKLNAGLRRISTLAHDAIYNSLKNWTFGSIIKKFTPESKMLQETISSVYNRVFKSPLLNKNLLVKIFDLVEGSLKKAAVKVQEGQGLNLQASVLADPKAKAPPLFDD